MQRILAIDAGGTSTRAVIVEPAGRCLGFGVAGGGNPISAGYQRALESFSAATDMALGADRAAVEEFSTILIAMAGKSAQLPLADIAARLEGMGVRGHVQVESDLLAMFCSGTWCTQGYSLLAGTGSVAARVAGGQLDLVAGGTGWLLGDDGSGFWIGHRVVRAAIAQLDGLGPPTALTELLLDSLQLTRTPERDQGRPMVLFRLIETLYAMRPVELSRFAPLAFRAPGDQVAAEILNTAATALVGMLATVRDPVLDGPLVLGGSVLNEGLLAPGSALAAGLEQQLAAAELHSVRDGVVGAAVLALRHTGVEVDRAIFQRLARDVEGLR
ncbi:MAG: N-acetylglucosamine kinase [Actinomycetota bacterium]|nr:N-acetylglucosamine kinase [Actinomycetota bacterium]